MAKLGPIGWILLRAGVSAALLTVIVWRIPWTGIGEAFHGSEPAWILAAILLAGAQVTFVSLRWQALLGAQEIVLSLGETLRLTLIGHFFSAFLPGSTGGDLARIYYAVRAAPRQKAAASFSVVCDRLVGVIILLLIGCAFSPVLYYGVYSRNFLIRKVLLLFLLVAVGILLFSLLAWLLPWLLRRRSFRLWEKHAPLHRLLEELSHVLRRFAAARWTAGRAALFALCGHIATFALAWCTAIALHLPVPFWILAAVLAVVSVLDAIPISISGLGVREGLLVLFFQPLSWTGAQAVTFSLLFFGVSLFWSFAGGILYWRYKAGRSAEERKIAR
ncbi:putative Uncharacterized conserved membrane protein [Methylacidimicrobium sp. AP8]|uniref:lysylphosphatidylglycerol synthase transmembrane domain-containing protein n=1 Tax=Methylacidimicrobium sp. AP8 TaxID=2730359 RepID=UPI0018C0024E|nr:lysylphosphatidylglycerol synthase transmembrane domain-containing protein [Methylacidimicrobium sp. AP8]CAB4242473.1 putative Uncharacterized conserved membrane protein [Methylacidimicrobium sp. AP8]